MYFKQSDFFTGMDHGFVENIMARGEKKSYQAGDIVFREGDQTQHFYILIKGHVKLRIGKDGHTVYVINHAGECFGWSSLINRSRYSASAVCAAPTTLMQLEKTHMRAILKSNPANGLIFMERLAGMIGERLLLSYRTLGSLAMLAAHPTDGTGQVQESLELA
jgi:CRP/FNR family transcriptional regulator, cyclic AMP receptor protein